MKARAKLFGHPIHQMLIVLPLGLLSGAVAFDVIALFSDTDQFSIVSYWLIDAPNNLYESVEYDGGGRGDFGKRAHHRSAYQSLEANAAVASLSLAGLLAIAAASAREAGARKLLAAGAVALTGKALLAGLYER